MRDDLLAILYGGATIGAAKVLGFLWVGEGFKAILLGFLGSAGGLAAKMVLQHVITKIKIKYKTKFRK